MKASRYSLERIGIGLLLCVALAMPLTSLVVLRGPDGEDSSEDGFQVIPGLTLLRTSLSVMADYPITPERATSYQDVRTAPVSQRVGELPFSLNNVSVAPAELIFTALHLRRAGAARSFDRSQSGRRAEPGGRDLCGARRASRNAHEFRP